MRSYIDKKLYEQNSYTLEDSIPIPSFEAWCENCQSKTEVEVIPKIEKILEVIAQTKEASTEPVLTKDYFDESNIWNEGLSEEEKQRSIQKHFKFLEWRKQRRSPRKCLECGSEKIKELEKKELWDSFGEICESIIYYDFEGNKLTKETAEQATPPDLNPPSSEF